MENWRTVRSVHLKLSDGYLAHGRLWEPHSPRGAVLYLHGIQSHGGWFVGSAEALCDAGFLVLLPDRRGSGRNSDQRGHAPSARVLTDDVRCALDYLRRRWPRLALHIVAVSWGGKLALAAAGRWPGRFRTMTLICPGLFSRIGPTLAERGRIAVAALLQPRRLFGIGLDEPRLFTDNPERIRFIEADPLRLRQVSSSMMLASRVLDFQARVAAGRIGCPVHLMLSGRDRIIDSRRTERFVRRHMRGVTVSWFDQAAHTLEFESDPTRFYTALVDWLNRQGR